MDKINVLKDANKKLHICDDLSQEKNRNLIFVYCPPKVGSTTLVSSIRLSAPNKFTVLHVHDETMLNVLCGVNNVTINEIIRYNKGLGKNVYVIDIYRNPIEHKISVFFEKIGTYHFNNTESNINNYNVEKLIQRFNRIFPYLANSDYYRDVFSIAFPETFDFGRKYINRYIDGIHYIKLRLRDSSEWTRILRDVLGSNITIVNDYETENKPISNIYKRFKEHYRIPQNFLELIQSCKNMNYYLSPQEIQLYIQSWKNKQTGEFIALDEKEYKIYNEITRENQHISDIQRNHYMDVGCSCVGCSRKRNIILGKVNRGENVTEAIDHNKAIGEYKKMVVNKKKAKLAALIKTVNNITIAKKEKLKKNTKNIINNSFGKIVR